MAADNKILDNMNPEKQSIELMKVPHREAGLVQYRFDFDGFSRTFRLYTPEGLLDKTHLPMVISLHGGDFARSHERTTWHLLAEEKGFLVLYPESLRDSVTWNAWNLLDRSHDRPDDILYLDYLITLMPKAFGADVSRIYLHGQSCGDMIGMHYCYIHPNRVAAAFLCSGPTKTKWWMTPDGELRFVPSGPCPVMRLHGENDVFQASGISPMEARLYKQQCHVERNSMPWMGANDCADVPVIYSNEEFNGIHYHGKSGCDFVDLYTKEGVHRSPLKLEREAWELFFMGYRLEDGRHVRTVPERTVEPDSVSVAVAAGTATCLINGTLVLTDAKPVHSLDGEMFLDVAMFMAICRQLDKEAADLSVYSMEERDYVSFSEAMLSLGYCVNTMFETAYATRAPSRLTFDLAYTIRRILGVQKTLTDKEAFLLEDRIYKIQCADKGFNPPVDRLEEVWQWSHTI